MSVVSLMCKYTLLWTRDLFVRWEGWVIVTRSVPTEAMHGETRALRRLMLGRVWVEASRREATRIGTIVVTRSYSKGQGWLGAGLKWMVDSSGVGIQVSSEREEKEKKRKM